MSDFSKLSLDELLAQIKGDSGYKDTKAAEKKPEAETPEVSEPSEAAKQVEKYDAEEDLENVFFETSHDPEDTEPKEEPEDDSQVTFEEIMLGHTAEFKLPPEFRNASPTNKVPLPVDKPRASSLDELLAQVSGMVDSAFGSVESVPAAPTPPTFARQPQPIIEEKDKAEPEFSLNSHLATHNPSKSKADQSPTDGATDTPAPVAFEKNEIATEAAPIVEKPIAPVAHTTAPIEAINEAESKKAEPIAEKPIAPFAHTTAPIEAINEVESKKAEPITEKPIAPVAHTTAPIEAINEAESKKAEPITEKPIAPVAHTPAPIEAINEVESKKAEPIVEKPVALAYNSIPIEIIDETEAEEAEPIIAEPAAPVTYNPEPIEVIDETEAKEAEPISEENTAPVSYNPTPIEIIDETEKEEATPITAEPAAPVTYNPEPIEVIDETEKEEPAPAGPAPIEVIDEKEDRQEESKKADNTAAAQTHAQPTVDEELETAFSAFGSINMNVDIDSMFPQTQSNNSVEIVIENPENDENAHSSAHTVNEDAPDETKEAADEIPPKEAKTIIIGDLASENAIFERPGIVTGRKMFTNTADLRALPVILPADELLKDEYQSGEKTFVRTGNIPILAHQKAPQEKPDDAQMLLPGFGEAVEVEHIDEEKAETELKRNRSKMVGTFKLEGVDSDDSDEPFLTSEAIDELNESGGEGRKRGRRFSLIKTHVRLNKQSVEYTRPSDRAAVFEFIAHKKFSALAAAAISGLCTLVMLFTTAIPSFAERIDSAYQPAFLGSIPSSYIFSLVLLVGAALAGLPTYSSGLTALFSGTHRPNSQTPVFMAVSVSIIQIILAIVLYDGTKMPIFALAASLAICLCATGKQILYSRVAQNFSFIVSRGKEGLYSIRSIDKAGDASALGQNNVLGDADVRYSGKAKFATNFLAYSLASDSADDLCVKLVPIVTVVSAIIGVLAALVSKNVLCGISLFSGALCMGAPASAGIAANLPLSTANQKLREDGAIITSYASAFEYESTNAITVDASDLFPGTCCNIYGMKTFNGVRVDDAILTAASMIISAGGPISGLFNDVVMGRKELLLNVEELTYEDKLGLSGWIRGRRIFVGNRKMLENHNIEIPMSIDETRYRHDGRRIIYLADAGKIVAFFVVSYGTDLRIVEHLRKIESNGINILIRTTDSNITEDFVANCFGIPVNSVKIISAGASGVLKSYEDRTAVKTDAKIIHNGSSLAFLHAVSAASSLCSTAGAVSTQQSFCTAAGLLLMAVIVIFSGAFNVTALQVCICQLVWLVIGAVLPLAYKE